MPNSITIRTSAPGAKQTAADINGVAASAGRLATASGKVKDGLAIGFGVNAVGLVRQGIGAITDSIGGAIEAYKQQEIADAKMRTSLDQNVTGWQFYKGAIDDAIQSAVNYGFQDDTFQESFAEVAGATHDVGKALRIMSGAEDLARFKHISLQDAARALTKVEGGRFRLLGELGIKVDGLKDSEEALRLVEQLAAGQADAYTQTQQGKLDVVDARLDATREKIGERLVPAQVAFNETILSGVDALSDFGDGYKDMTDKTVTQPKLDFLSSLPSKQEVEASLAGLKAIPGEIDGTMQGLLFNLNIGGVKDTWQKSIDDLNNYLATTAFNGTGQAIAKGWEGEGQAALDKMFSFWESTAVSSKWATIFTENITNKSPLIAKAAEETWSGINDEFDRAATETAREAGHLPGEVGDAITANKDFVKDGMKDLMYLINHPLKRQKEIARVEGALTSAKLAEGLGSNDPAVRGAALAWQQELVHRWELLTGKAFHWGAAVGNAFVEAYKNKLSRLGFDLILRNISNAGPTTGGQAFGGDVYAGQSYRVGEAGPEMFVPSTNGTIIPNNRIGDGGGGLSISTLNVNVTAPQGTDAPQWARQVADSLANELRYQSSRLSEAARY